MFNFKAAPTQSRAEVAVIKVHLTHIIDVEGKVSCCVY